MCEVEVVGRVSENLKNLAKKVAISALSLLSQPKNLCLAIKFVSAAEIRRLNIEFRQKDSATDVLSFPSTSTVAGEIVDIASPELSELFDGKNYHIGDMAICTKVLRAQAKEFGVSAEAECKKLVIHSVLHLLGYDHISDSDYELMHKREVELDSKIKI